MPRRRRRPQIQAPALPLLPAIQAGGRDAAEWLPPTWKAAPGAPLLTLITDASVSPQNGSAAWAAWAKWMGADQLWCGPYSSAECLEVALAELCAIGNGIDRALKWFDPGPGVMIVIRSDSLTAINWLVGRTNIKKERPRQVVDQIRVALSLYGAAIRVRHVKGHQRGPDVRPAGYINQVVDKAAYQARKQLEHDRRAA
ncbi:MAG: RNase H family protein [Elsteraceae bacterium]